MDLWDRLNLFPGDLVFDFVAAQMDSGLQPHSLETLTTLKDPYGLHSQVYLMHEVGHNPMHIEVDLDLPHLVQDIEETGISLSYFLGNH